MNHLSGELEKLPNGMDAMFISQPQWMTTSARLLVNAGSLHEESETPPGVAHFFEHVTFQGTELFRSVEDYERYTKYNGMYTNASTSQSETKYIADAYELDHALTVVTQLGMAPLLTPNMLERERRAIIDEARGIQFSPGTSAYRKQMAVFGGTKLAKMITGTVDEVSQITSVDLSDFHQRHYRAKNMMLLVCGSASVQEQRDTAIETIEKLPVSTEGNPVLWDLPWLQSEQKISVIQNDMPKESQTNVTINYEIENPTNVRESILLGLAANILGQAALRRIRRELTIAYHAGGQMSYLVNRSFGIREYYRSFALSSSLNGEDTEICLEELTTTVPEYAVSNNEVIESTVKSWFRSSISLQEQTPSNIIDQISNNFHFDFDRIFDPTKVSDLLNEITVPEIKDTIKSMVSEPSLIQITSPDENVVLRFKC